MGCNSTKRCARSPHRTNRIEPNSKRSPSAGRSHSKAAVQKLERVQPRIDAAWNELQRRVGYLSPPVATAFLIMFLGIGALVVDAILLGPGLDAIGIQRSDGATPRRL